jgi:hypothetical protein
LAIAPIMDRLDSLQDDQQSNPAQEELRQTLARMQVALNEQREHLQRVRTELARAPTGPAQIAIPREVKGVLPVAPLSQSLGSGEKVAYVVDGSAAMLNCRELLVSQLKQELATLSPRQKFALLVFRDNRTQLMPQGAMVPATDQHRQACLDWLEGGALEASGLPNPVDAISRAVSLQPDRICIVAARVTARLDGMISSEELFDEMRRLNGKRRIKIDTIQLFDLDHDGAMAALAHAYRGIHRQLK